MSSLRCKLGWHQGEWNYEAANECIQIRACERCGKERRRFYHAWGAWSHQGRRSTVVCSRCNETHSTLGPGRVRFLDDAEGVKKMSVDITLDPTSPLAPSELILINGEEFADVSRQGERVNLININGAVQADQLGEMMLATAFLANEQAGGVQLEISQQSGFFGESMKLGLMPGNRNVAWPVHSLEAEVHRQVSEGAKDASDIIYTLLGKDSQYPWKWSLAQVAFDGMHSRNLLDAHESASKERRLWGKSGYILPDSTANMAAQQAIEPIQQLLAACKHTRPEIWRSLLKDINKAVDRRTIKSSN